MMGMDPMMMMGPGSYDDGHGSYDGMGHGSYDDGGMPMMMMGSNDGNGTL